jgi:hypothetical protein
MAFPWFHAVILVASYAAFPLGVWMIWPSRWNVIAMYQFGFFVVAYLIPIMFTGVPQIEPSYPSPAPALLNLFTEIMAAGACFFLCGIVTGANLPRLRFASESWLSLSATAGAEEYVYYRCISLLTVAVAGLYVSFPLMGYVPALSADPLQAKYFHGVYRPGYLRAVWLYLPCFYVFVAYTPLVVLLISRRPRLKYLAIFAAGLVALALTLHRGDFGGPFLLGIGFVMAASRLRHPMRAFLLVCVLSWSLGAVANYGMAIFLGLHTEGVATLIERPTLAGLIASGSPDLGENLEFLRAFLAHGEYTFGRNWVGGLIPLQSYWNPGLWALSVALDISHAEVVNAVSGGLRIAVPLTGFSCLDWPGVLLFSFIIGGLGGYIIGCAKRKVASDAPVAVKAVWVLVASILLDNVGAPTWHTLIPLITLAPLVHPVRIVSGLKIFAVPGNKEVVMS